MKNSLAQFTALRAKLATEHAELKQRLQEIEAALGISSKRSLPAAPRLGRPPGSVNHSPGGRRPNGSVTMRDAIEQALKGGALSIAELVEAMPRFGYRFTSSNPKNSAGAYLYGPGKKFFRNSGGRFSVK